ncbi:FGGY family carbohydrate kinase [Paenibacillus qinlingensis]|uniref:Sedoheptulokinase n=1 Tax=Paenibacillus qinlingensis TaxID=1837343 RepID=A0ABU1P1B7_9BACL|nr:FGGY family carbohydrate kinase [Paenibacillus qinlingensis]MDR6553131.1 sedoheptulokinase [Paenibacillus qinlingensis]
MYTAGIDIGTTSICVVVTNIQDGSIIRIASRANDSEIPATEFWERTQNGDRIVELVNALLAECQEDWTNVDAIGIACQMHGVLYVDKEGQAVSPLFTWQDGRGDLHYASGQTYAATLNDRTGYPVNTGFGLVTHFYMTQQDEIPMGAVKLCTIGDYVAMKLCGEAAPFMDRTNAASIGLYSLETGRFDNEKLSAAGMDASFLPELATDRQLIGETADGKKVVCAIGDNQASFLGAVPTFESNLLVNVGTGSQVSVYSPSFMQSPMLETRPFIDGGYLLVGASLSGGKSYEVLEQFFRSVLGAFAEAEENRLYEAMNRLAEEAMTEAVPPLRVGTQFYGTREHPEATGFIQGIRADNFNAKQLTAGFLHGILDELVGCTQQFPTHIVDKLARLVASGNGLRKNAAMQHIAQLKWQLPLTFGKVEEEAAFGAAIHAAVVTGYFRNYEEALQRMQRSDSHEA